MVAASVPSGKMPVVKSSDKETLQLGSFKRLRELFVTRRSQIAVYSIPRSRCISPMWWSQIVSFLRRGFIFLANLCLAAQHSRLKGPL